MNGPRIHSLESRRKSRADVIRSCIFASTLIVFAVIFSGCAITLGTIVFLSSSKDAPEEALHDGWLESTIEFSLPTASKAVLSTLKANSLPFEIDTLDADSSLITSKYGDGLDIRIELRQIDFRTTLIRIHVGENGHFARSRHLRDTIVEILAKEDEPIEQGR